MKMVRQRYKLRPPRDNVEQRIIKPDWPKSTISLSQLKAVVAHATFPWWISPFKKSKIWIDSLQRYCWSKNLAIWSDKRHTWPHPTISGSLRYHFLLMIISIQKISWTFPEKLMIRESCNLIGQEAKMATPNKE